MQGSRLWVCIILSFFLGMLVSCGDGGSSPSGGGGGTGTVSLSLTDATISGEARAVYITIEEVSVHRSGGGGWEVILAEHGETYNLLELVNAVRQELGIAELGKGHYTQLRMKLTDRPGDGLNILSERHPYGNYVVDQDDVYTELKIPSGFQTGVKVVCGFDINENETTEVVLDFDVAKSIVEAGNSENLILKPTIRVFDLEEYSIISGVVTDEETADGVEYVLVSAQVYDDSDPIDDPKDKVIVQASTKTDASGSYAIFVAPGTYSVVAYKDGYSPACAEVEALPGATHTVDDLQLALAENIGTISGEVTITNGSEDQHATISFRQSATCSGDEKEIELKSINVIQGGTYSEPLPAASYTVVASTYDRDTLVANPTVNPSEDTPGQDFNFEE